jgi:hypothetical protein
MAPIPLEVDLVIKNIKDSANALSQLGGGKGGEKEAGSIIGLLSAGIKTLTAIAASVGVIGFVVGSLRIAQKILDKMLKVLELMFRPIDLVIGKLLMFFLRFMLPIVRAINVMFRPFLQKINQSARENASGGMAGGGNFIKDVSDAFGDFLTVLFLPMFAELAKMINNNFFAAIEALTAFLGALGVITLKAFGFTDAANTLAVVTGTAIGNMELLRQAMNITIDQAVVSLTEEMTNTQTATEDLTNTLDPATLAIQGIVTAIASIDPVLEASVKKGFIEANASALAFAEALAGEGGIKSAMDILTQSTTVLMQNQMSLLTSQLNLTGIEAGFLEGTLGNAASAMKSFADAIEDVIDAAKDLIGGGDGGSKKKSIFDLPKDALSFASQLLGGKGFNDFIYRPGEKPIAFSPNDTIIGTKGGIGGSGQTVNITVNVSGFVGSESALTTAIGKEMRKQLNQLTSYARGTG